MADNTVQLVQYERIANESAIELLQEWLDAAKAGEVVAVGLAGVRYDGATRTQYSETANAGTLIGACARLQYRMIAAHE